MTYYFKSGKTYRIATNEQVDMREELPAGNYIVQFSELTGFYLETTDSFNIPKKLYGKTEAQTERFLKCFELRKKSTSILLVGEKGCGKTLLAQNISKTSGFPVLFVNRPYNGDQFNTFLQQIEQPFVLLFDEFEKVYDDEDDQNGLLTLLEGVFSTNSINLFTSNSIYALNSYMKNRPGRIRYLIEFNGLTSDFVREYCEDKLKNTKHVDALVQIAGTFDKFNFDMMQALVEEVNLFDEVPSQAIEMLNIRQDFADRSSYVIDHVTVDGKPLLKTQLHKTEVNASPLNQSFAIHIRDDEESDFQRIEYNRGDLKHVGPDGTEFVFVNKEGVEVRLSKKPEQTYGNGWGYGLDAI